VRHGGDATVPTCIECHSQKDRCHPLGSLPDGTPDGPVFNAIVEGMAELAPAIDATTGARVPLVAWTIQEHMFDVLDTGNRDRNGSDGMVAQIEQTADFVAWSIAECTTPEARIWLARAFACYLDMLDDALLHEMTAA
jgi:hypothetical protein